jgi:hypothetical protein
MISPSLTNSNKRIFGELEKIHKVKNHDSFKVIDHVQNRKGLDT